jgi:hypothetical protein
MYIKDFRFNMSKLKVSDEVVAASPDCTLCIDEAV